MINEDALRAYLLGIFPKANRVDIRKLGSGGQGSGFLIEIGTESGVQSYVVKTLLSEGLGHDYPSDRASVFLLDLDEYNNLPAHVKALDVLSEMEGGTIKSIGGGKEYYLLMEKAEGEDYFKDLAGFAKKDSLYDVDVGNIQAMASYLAEIHSVKKESKTLYWRKLRDTVGHGECLMGVFDTYPDGTMTYEEMAEITKKSVDWIARLKPRYKRLSRIHGDFHPGNIWFRNKRIQKTPESKPTTESRFVLLDRSRGPWGEPADDVTALAINYIFFSVKNHNDVRGAYLQGLTLFFHEYIRLSGDREINEVAALFFAFRGAVVANPVFYPELTREQRSIIFRFVNKVLDSERFEPEKVKEYFA
jgi:hypothetical protein